MPNVSDVPPEGIREELKLLRDALDVTIPSKALDKNLLIATWNLRAFGDITEKWKAGDKARKLLLTLFVDWKGRSKNCRSGSQI